MRSSLLKESGAPFYEGIIHEDNLFNFETMAFAKRTVVLNMPLYYRRIRGGSITQTPQSMSRIRSFSICVVNAKHFSELHPQIKGSACEKWIKGLLSAMFYYWFFLTNKEQKSEQCKNYFKKIKPVEKEYKSMGCVSRMLFFTCIPAYKFWSKLLSLKKNILKNLNFRKL